MLPVLTAVKNLWISKRCSTAKDTGSAHGPYEINQKMVAFSREVGKGHATLNTFSRVINSPNIDHRTYDKLSQKLQNVTKLEAEKCMLDAASKIKETGTDTIVSLDGTWKKGYFSFP